MPYPHSERFNDALLGYHVPVISVRALSSIQFGPNPEGLPLDVLSGNVKLSSTADIKGTLDMSVAGSFWDSLKPYGVEIFVERGVDFGNGEQEYVPCGYYRVQKINQPNAPDGPITVTGQDRGARLKEHRVLFPYSYGTGTTHRQIFNDLINGLTLGPSPFDRITWPMYQGKTVPITFLGYDPDDAKLPSGVVTDFVGDFLGKIADARGCILRWDRTGGLLVDSRDRAPGTPPNFFVTTGEQGNMISLGRELSRDATYNAVVAYGSDPAYPTGFGYTFNDDGDSPLNINGPFEAVVRKYASPLLHTLDQVGTASRTLVLRYKGLPSGVSSIVLPDPSIDPLDVCYIEPQNLPPDTQVVDTVTIPLTITQPCTVDLRAQNEVSDEPDTTGGDEPGDPGSPGGAPIFAAKFRDGRAHPNISGAGASTIVNVSSSAQLTSALAAAAGGQVITLAPATYSGTFTINKKGTQALPIVIRSGVKGGAVLASGSKFIADGAEWVKIEGLTAPYDQAGDTFVIQGASKFVRFTRCLVGPAYGPVTAKTYKVGFASCINDLYGTDSDCFDRARTMGIDYWYNAGDTWYKDGASPDWVSDWQSRFASPKYAAMLATVKGQWINVSDHEGYANDAPASAFAAPFQTAYRTAFPDFAPYLPATGIYRTWNFQRVQFIQMDQRSFRSDDAATDNSSKTMLGATQKAWFKALVGRNQYPLIVVLGDVPIHTPTTTPDDAWSAFNTERVELQAAMDASTSKFIYLHGNMHALMRKSNVFGYDKAWGAAPLNNETKVSAGGANIDASYPTNANEGPVMQLFGVVTITESSTGITAGFKGYSSDGTERISDSLTVTAAAPPATSASTPQGSYFRVTDTAQDCVIDYNEIRNKMRPGNGISVDGDTSVAANAGGCQHILIAHNFFHDFGTEIDNGFEALRFGSSDLSRTVSNSCIMRNVFINIECEPEVISVKMGTVDLWGNTLDKCVGGLVYRHGTKGYIGHNYLFGPKTGSAGTKGGGVRIYDADHEVSENYMGALTGDLFTGALVIDGGDAGTVPLSGHWPVKNAKVKNNLIYNCQTGILVGPNYDVAPDSINVVNNTVVIPAGQTTSLKTTKPPTGTNVLDPNPYFGTYGASGLVLDASGGFQRKDGFGPRLTWLTEFDAGIYGDLGELDGTGKSIGGSAGAPPDGGGGTPTDPGTPATSISNLLKLGTPSGFSKCNIGVGKTSGHVDYDLAAIENGLSIPGYFELTTDGLRAKLSVPLDGGTTSSNTQYARVEFRQLKADGTTKESFNPNENKVRFVGIKSRVTKMPPSKPQLVLAQCHDASDDTAMIYMPNKTSVTGKLGDTVVGTLTSSLAFGTDYYAMIKVIGDGSKCKLEYYWGTTFADMSTPKLTTANATRSTTWYMKAGNYGQSNENTDNVSDGPFIVEMSKCVFWETGMPAPLGWS